MKTLPLLGTCLLTALCALPASATPVMDVALFVSQASINPIYMHYEGIDGSVAALDQAIEAFTAVDPEAAKKPGRTTFSNIILKRGLMEAAEQNQTTDASGKKVLDCEGFAATFSEMLSNKYPENMKFAASGWGVSEKQAAKKFAAIARNPTWEGTHEAIIAILIGLLTATEDEVAGLDSRAGSGILKAQEAALESMRHIGTWEQATR